MLFFLITHKFSPNRNSKSDFIIYTALLKYINITQNEEVFIYIIEEKVPVYPAALVKKMLVKSIRPETSWLLIQ